MKLLIEEDEIRNIIINYVEEKMSKTITQSEIDFDWDDGGGSYYGVITATVDLTKNY